MAATSIEWATHVWNPFTGCDRVSPGCAHCYALTYAGRLKAMGPERQPKYQNDGDPKTSGAGFGFTVHWDQLGYDAPKFPAGARVFVNSMSDVFHEEAPLEAIAQLFDAFRLQPNVNFLVLTKRAERMREVMEDVYNPYFIEILEHGEEFLPNVWLGVSIENRRFVERADMLRETPAAVRFISAEPLLGPLVYCGRVGGASDLELDRIDWLIVGGESGPRSRQMNPQWARELRLAAAEARVAFFFKQWGGRTPKAGGRELDGRTWDEFPQRQAATA